VGDLLQLRDTHEQAQMLLPWRVNGTLEPGEEALLEAHLAECEECRRDLAANRALRELYAAAPVEERSEPFALPRARRTRQRPSGRRWEAMTRRARSGWGNAAVAAAAAVLALAVFVVPAEREGGFRLLGADEAPLEGNAIVLFSPDTAERDLRAALEAAGARLVDGPTASGAYVVLVPREDRAEALAGLRALPQVVLAEPVDAAGEP
jgi:hypothetical protein